MHTLTLTPPAHKDKKTTIQIGRGMLQSELLKRSYAGHIVILYDEGVAAIARTVSAFLDSPTLIPVKSGDASKSLAEAERIVSSMLDAGCTRDALLVCIGGGMLTDLGGFVASIFMRGIPCVLIPTSMLGMVDAAIGGKTAVNVGGRKNMIGTVTHPESVLIDTALLDDLPPERFSEGLVEVIKIAAILDLPFFEWLEKNMQDILKKNHEIISECVLRAVQAKVHIVERDDSDRDARLLLNFGHTVGHAVEALSHYELSHGAAVSIGLLSEMRLQADPANTNRVRALLEAIAMPLLIPKKFSADALWSVMLSDKKNESGVVKVAVPKRLGEGKIHTLSRPAFDALFS